MKIQLSIFDEQNQFLKSVELSVTPEEAERLFENLCEAKRGREEGR